MKKRPALTRFMQDLDTLPPFFFFLVFVIKSTSTNTLLVINITIYFVALLHTYGGFSIQVFETFKKSKKRKNNKIFSSLFEKTKKT